MGDGTVSGRRRSCRCPPGSVAWVFRAGVVARALLTARLPLVFLLTVRLPLVCLVAALVDTFVGVLRRARLGFRVRVFRVAFCLLDDALDDLWALLLERRAFTPPP